MGGRRGERFRRPGRRVHFGDPAPSRPYALQGDRRGAPLEPRPLGSRAGQAAGAVTRSPYERRCLRMVREQILARGIDDTRLLEAFLWAPRHLFVDEALSGRAYSGMSLPIGCGQTLSQPYIIARMLALLDVRPGQTVLEVGTGSGYQAAILWR